MLLESVTQFLGESRAVHAHHVRHRAAHRRIDQSAVRVLGNRVFGILAFFHVIEEARRILFDLELDHRVHDERFFLIQRDFKLRAVLFRPNVRVLRGRHFLEADGQHGDFLDRERHDRPERVRDFQVNARLNDFAVDLPEVFPDAKLAQPHNVQRGKAPRHDADHHDRRDHCTGDEADRPRGAEAHAPLFLHREEETLDRIPADENHVAQKDRGGRLERFLRPFGGHPAGKQAAELLDRNEQDPTQEENHQRGFRPRDDLPQEHRDRETGQRPARLPRRFHHGFGLREIRRPGGFRVVCDRVVCTGHHEPDDAPGHRKNGDQDALPLRNEEDLFDREGPFPEGVSRKGRKDHRRQNPHQEEVNIGRLLEFDLVRIFDVGPPFRLFPGLDLGEFRPHPTGMKNQEGRDGDQRKFDSQDGHQERAGAVDPQTVNEENERQNGRHASRGQNQPAPAAAFSARRTGRTGRWGFVRGVFKFGISHFFSVYGEMLLDRFS